MTMFSENDLLMIALILDEEEEEKAVKKRMWVHKARKKRPTEGEFSTLYKELMDDGTKFFEYFRLKTEYFRTNSIIIGRARCDDGDNTVCVGTVTRRTCENVMLIFPLRILLTSPGESRNEHGTVTSLLCVNRPLVVRPHGTRT
ncbi:hypothetical protein QTP88_026450 [Uroleucon formosanum]